MISELAEPPTDNPSDVTAAVIAASAGAARANAASIPAGTPQMRMRATLYDRSL
jgi:hypothetical protein